jgi:hypothetical protein
MRETVLVVVNAVDARDGSGGAGLEPTIVSLKRRWRRLGHVSVFDEAASLTTCSPHCLER